MLDPHILVGLATLIVLELVLGIDNLVFIAILAAKLPPHQRDKARLLGLGMAMVIRLALLAVVSHIIALTRPVIQVGSHGLSWRDIVLIVGGVFLLYKATSEIHERLEGGHQESDGAKRAPSFAITIAQIVILDAIFSLDSIITAVGMVDHLWVMMTAVVVSMGIMIAASKPLTAFVSRHPTVIILCLSFLLLIGCSLLAEGLGFHFPKEYLYAAIGFSLLIESLNQIGGHKKRKAVLKTPGRQRTADAILRLLNPLPGSQRNMRQDEEAHRPVEAGGLLPDETDMIRGVISLGTLQLRSIMTLRPEIVTIRADSGPDEIRDVLLECGRTRVLLCEESVDTVIGVIEVKEALKAIIAGGAFDLRAISRPAMFVQRTMTTTRLIDEMRRSDQRFAVVVSEDGQVEGVVTTTDIFAVIAGDLADDEGDDLVDHADNDRMILQGLARISDVEDHFDRRIGSDDRDYETVSGHVLQMAGRLPAQGESFRDDDLLYTVLETEDRRIERILIERTEGGIENG